MKRDDKPMFLDGTMAFVCWLIHRTISQQHRVFRVVVIVTQQRSEELLVRGMCLPSESGLNDVIFLVTSGSLEEKRPRHGKNFNLGEFSSSFLVVTMMA